MRKLASCLNECARQRHWQAWLGSLAAARCSGVGVLFQWSGDRVNAERQQGSV